MKKKVIFGVVFVILIMSLLFSNILAQNLRVEDVWNKSEDINFDMLKVEILNITRTKETSVCSDTAKIKNFYDMFIELPIYEEKEDNYLNIELIAEQYKYVYSASEGLEVKDSDMTKRYYLKQSDVLDCLVKADIHQWYSSGVVEGNIIDIIQDMVSQSYDLPVIKFKVNSPVFIVDDVESQIDEDNKNVVPFIDEESSRTMVPLRAFGNASGCSVEWIEDTGEIVLNNNYKTIEFAIGNSNITVSSGDQSEVVNMETAPVIVENRAFIPLRVISELLGYDVKWNGVENDILLERKQQ